MFKRVLAPTALLALVVFSATSCDKQTADTWTRSIKSSDMSCNFRGIDVWPEGYVRQVDVHCYFHSTAGGGEHPYVLVYVSGCSPYRINGGASGDTPLVRLSCVGDPFYDLGFKACQTHGGPLPDDCTDPQDHYDLRNYS